MNIGLIALLTGCAATQSAPASADVHTARVGTESAELAALAALEVVQVGALVPFAAGQGGHCYGVPCDESEATAAREVQVARLTELVDVVERAKQTPASSSDIEAACAVDAVEANLAALNSLEIVEVEGLLRAQPEISGACYAAPCPEDIARAEAQTCERAEVLSRVVTTLGS
jgi:hypothetical protein